MTEKKRKPRGKKAPETETPLLVSKEMVPLENAEEAEDEGEQESGPAPIALSEEALKEITERVARGELLQFSVPSGRGVRIVTFDPREEGMRISWRKFVDEYFKNGFNGTRAYMAVFPDVKNENVAAVKAHELLRNGKVVSLIRRRLDAEEIDDEWVLASLKDKARFTDGFRINAAVAATLGVAKIRGMLVDTKKVVFNQDNPAVFMAPYTEEEKAKFEEQAQKMGRITE